MRQPCKTSTRPATALNAAASVVEFFPVKAFTSLMKAPSFGINAVSATLPSVKTLTEDFGLAFNTASTADKCHGLEAS